MSTTTTDLSQFGYREIEMAWELLNAWVKGAGLPNDFDNSKVTIMMNTGSGNVFLTNEEFQVAMMNGNKLESLYSSPYEGKEGFFEDLLNEYADMYAEDKEWFRDIANNINRAGELPEEVSS